MMKKWLTMAVLLGLSLPVLAQDAASLFEPIASVLRHPRCLNCHTFTDYPKQGDERRRHDQLVMRGEDGHGAPTLQCGACHQDQNFQSGLVPGAPHWHLAPLSMGWEGLSDSELCEALLDQSRNGHRNPEELFHHMTEDALVLWAWDPGNGRTVPPLTRVEFRSALENWLNAAGPNGVPPCPGT